MPSANTAQVLFCWLRETAPGHLECDLGLPVDRADVPLAAMGLHPRQQGATTGTSVTGEQAADAFADNDRFQQLPEWARRRLSGLFGSIQSDHDVAAAKTQFEILAATAARALSAAPKQARIEIHLPYISRRGWPMRFDILGNTNFLLSEGRVVPATLAESSAELSSYNAMLLAAGATCREVGVELRHSIGRALPACSTASLLATAFGSEAPRGAEWPEVVVSQSLATAALNAWRRAPLETSPAYFPVHASVSVALQRAFRRWITWLWLSDPARWEDIHTTHAILAYAGSRPFPGRRTDFTWDLLSPDWMYAAFRFARRGLTARLRSMRQAMLSAGRKDLAERYKASQSKVILNRVRKQNKAVRDLLAAEGEVVNHVLQFGLKLRAADNAFEIGHEAAEFANGLGTRLRRISKDVDMTQLATMVMMEATNALHTALGGEDQLHTHFSVTSTGALESRAA